MRLFGEQSEEGLQPFYDAADLFVLASHHEGYGMALAEALAAGLPVVATTAGAIPDTVPGTAGILVPPGDPPALAGALRRVLSEPGLRQRLAAGARAARADLPELGRCRPGLRRRAGHRGGQRGVSRFEKAWLRLREPYDHAARSRALADRFAEAVGPTPRLLDLGAGAGSNLRYLAPRLPAAQRWLLVDHDPELLAQARAGGAPTVECQVLDLAQELPKRSAWTGITAAALLDLTSAAWLDRLARWCRGIPVLMALSVDGRLAWRPEEPEDAAVRERFFAHQHSDKGFGPALGADAARYLAQRLEAEGQRVFLERSDWRLGPPDAPLLAPTLAGIFAVQASGIERWAAARRRQLGEGRLHLTIGHVDLLALPG